MNVSKCRVALGAMLGLALITVAVHASSSVSFVFAGDSTLDDDAGELIAKGGDPFADFTAYFAAADIRITNLECVIATRGGIGR